MLFRKNYNANPNLKAAGVAVEYTPEQVAEYIKCKEDPKYFIENYCMIVSLDKGLIPFKLYECQKAKVDMILNERRVLLMEGRQQGKTITSAACILHYTIFQDSKTVAILANKAAAAREVLARYQLMFENLPSWLQQGVTTWNKGDIELENGSKVFTAATSGSAIRGRSVNWLYVDEAAIIPNTVAEDFFTSVYPTISAGETTKILLSSTPMGYNHFWKFWNDAEQRLNEFKTLFIPYWEIPGRDEKWAETQKALLGELKFNQEVLCKWLGSSLTLISGDTLAQLSPAAFLRQHDGLDILEMPIAHHTYQIVADVSAGLDGDYSACTVIDVTQMPYKIVAKYRDKKISPFLYPNILAKVGKTYNMAQILLEINFGEQVAYILYNELEYENLVSVSRTPKGQRISGGFGSGSSHMGVMTTKQVKRIGCQTLKNLIESKKLIIQDVDIISELSTFIETRGSYAADDGYHDDLVMTLVLFGWLTNDPYFTDLNDVNLRQEMYESQMKQIEDELTPFGFYDDGQVDEVQTYINF